MQSRATAPPPSSSAAALNLAEMNERLPHNLTVRRGFGGLEILSRRRNWPLIGGLTLFCAIWDPVFVLMAIKGSVPLIFWFSHGLTGLFLTAYLVNLVVNHTRIEVAHGQLRVRRGPMPWPGRTTVEVANIKRLYVSGGNNKLNGRVLLALWLEETGGRSRALIDPLPDEEVGRALETLVEDHLGIDESAPGRLRRR